VICTVTVNPCLDLIRFVGVDEPSLSDGTYRPDNPNDHEKVRPGGKGLDVSRALVCLGSETKALGFIGDQTGDIVKGLLEAEGIDHGFIESGVETRTNIILVLQDRKTGQVLGEIRVNSQGREIPPNKFHLLYDQANRIEDADAVAISGSLNFNMQPTFYNQLIRTFKEKNPRCTVVLDGPAAATAEAMALSLHRPDYIKPNLKEFNDLLVQLSGGENCLWPSRRPMPPGVGDEQYLEYVFTGTNHGRALPRRFVVDREQFTRNWETLLKHVLTFKEKFKVGVLLSLGPRGCLTATDEGEVLHAYLPVLVNPKTRVGAGDSLVAGFLAEHVRQRAGNIQEALKGAVAAATARVCVEEYGANNKYLDRKQYMSTFKKVRVDVYRPGEKFEPKFLDAVPPELTRFTNGEAVALAQSKPAGRQTGSRRRR
jgi:fructose-1-phosphate kinase PfkB-like protein